MPEVLQKGHYHRTDYKVHKAVPAHRPVEGAEDSTQTEVRISCPDATGLGCDVARMLFDFGLRILEGAAQSLMGTSSLSQFREIGKRGRGGKRWSTAITWNGRRVGARGWGAHVQLCHDADHVEERGRESHLVQPVDKSSCNVAGDVSTDGKWCFLIFKVNTILLKISSPPRTGTPRLDGDLHIVSHSAHVHAKTHDLQTLLP